MACTSAAFGGHLEVLQWARGQGSPWNAQTCANAAHNGHLEMLQWARSQGCPLVVEDALILFVILKLLKGSASINMS